jgi:preprotein translocase subunit SecA
MDTLLADAYGQNGKASTHAPRGSNGAAIVNVVEWANKSLGTALEPAKFEMLSATEARDTLLQEYDTRLRPELSRAERQLILEVLDTAWKDHLYYMDHLRSGIGLMGYAQKYPKVEYKREGVKAIDGMWNRVAEQVTGAIFRIDKQGPEFLGNLWQTETIHEDASSAPPAPGPAGTELPQPGQDVKAVDPIRNRERKVGRNDPCPCGSGKKYKKCHGLTAG